MTKFFVLHFRKFPTSRDKTRGATHEEALSTLGFLFCKMSGEWKQIEGYPKYEISSNGTVRRGNKTLRLFEIGGYYAFNVIDGMARRKSLRLHRELARAFIENPYSLPVVRHLDGNPKNCTLNNLAWGSFADNERDKLSHGRSRANVVLTDAEVHQIRELDLPNQAIANLYGVTRRHVWAIRTGRARR